MTKTVLVNSRMSRTSVYHTTECKSVNEIRTHQHGKAVRSDLTEAQAEQWGLVECKRCKAKRLDKKYTEVTA